MLELFLIYSLVYLGPFLFCIFQVGIGLLHLTMAKNLASKESVLIFLKELKFPANIYRFALEDFWNSGEDFEPYPVVGSVMTIIVFGAVAIFAYYLILLAVINPGKDKYGIVIGGFWLPVATLTFLRFQLWNFIRRPRAIDKKSAY